MSSPWDAAAGHRGLMYCGSRQLLGTTAPMIASALETGSHVVVLSRRWFAAALRGALHDVPHGADVEYRPARALAHGMSAELSDQLGLLAHPDRPTLVISQFVGSSTAPGALPYPAPSPPRTTLVCLCPFVAHDDVRTSFHDAHPILVEPSPVAPVTRAAADPERSPEPGSRPAGDSTSRGPSVRAAFGTVDDLSAVRAQVGRAAATAGLGVDERRRAVLAVHEAMVVACTLVRDDPATSRATPPCRVQVYAMPWRLVTEIDLPRSVAFPPGERDRDPLAHARAFCHEASWFGSLRTRHIRVVTRA